MTPSDWAALILTIGSIVVLVAGGVRFLVKTYFRDMRDELKPNSGNSLKDQVTRLEHRTEKIEEKIDNLYAVVLEHFIEKPSRKKSKVS